MNIEFYFLLQNSEFDLLAYAAFTLILSSSALRGGPNFSSPLRGELNLNFSYPSMGDLNFSSPLRGGSRWGLIKLIQDPLPTSP
jgi:hypothetical protein